MSDKPTRSDAGGRTPPAKTLLRARLRELRAAILFLTGARRSTLDPGEVARGGASFPALGLLLGALVAAVLTRVERSAPRPLVAALGVVLLWTISGGRLPRALGRVARAALARRRDVAATLAALDEPAVGIAGALVLAVVLLAKGLALSVLSGSTLAFAVVLAVTLGRWGIVVQAYGSLSARPDDDAAVFVREMKFGQFAVASVTAMAATLALSNAMGIVLLLGVATVTVGARIVVHRWLGGVAPATIEAGGELAETVALLICAGLVLLARSLET
jgi:cobalamin synthase